MKSFIEEFKAFAIKGNVIDLAVAVVIGAAFGKIVSSLVSNIIMPTIGIILGGINFSSMSVQVGESLITYGVFIQSVVDFVIVALVIFVVVKAIGKAQELAADEVPAEVEPETVSEDIQLLREIRDAVRL